MIEQQFQSVNMEYFTNKSEDAVCFKCEPGRKFYENLSYGTYPVSVKAGESIEIPPAEEIEEELNP